MFWKSINDFHQKFLTCYMNNTLIRIKLIQLSMMKTAILYNF